MKWSDRRASRVAYLIAKILYSGNFSAMVSPFRAAPLSPRQVPPRSGFTLPGITIAIQRLAYPLLVDGDFDAGTFLLQEHRDAGIALAPSAVERLRQLIQSEIRHRHRHVDLAAECGGERYVLVSEAQGEVRRIVHPGKEMGRQPVEGSRTSQGALTDGFPKRERLDARLDAHREYFGQRALEHVAGTVMHELRDGRRADWADVARLIADRVEHGLVLVEDLAIAADPDCELAGRGSTRTATDRRVEHMDAAIGESGIDAAHDGRRIRREVEICSARAQTAENAVLAQCNFLHIGGAG